MKMIRVIKAKLNTEEQLSKYMNKGYSLYLDYQGKGKAFIFQKDNKNSGRDISVDFEVAEQFAHDHNLYKDFESEALHYVEYLMEDNSNFNKTSADNDWWKKYYIETSIEDPDEFQEDYGYYIEEANLTPIAFLEYKDEYESELGNMEPLWLVEDKQGNRFPIVVNMGRVRKVNENNIKKLIPNKGKEQKEKSDISKVDKVYNILKKKFEDADDFKKYKQAHGYKLVVEMPYDSKYLKTKAKRIADDLNIRFREYYTPNYGIYQLQFFVDNED